LEASRVDHGERACRADLRQLRGRGVPVAAGRRLLRGAAAARALSVQARRAPGRAVAPDAARALAARARPLSIFADWSAVAPARRRGVAGDAGRDGVSE